MAKHGIVETGKPGPRGKGAAASGGIGAAAKRTATESATTRAVLKKASKRYSAALKSLAKR